MRAWLYNRIKEIDLPRDMEARIISSGAADNPAVPFLVVSMGVEQQVMGAPTAMGVFETPFDVWVHDRPGSMLDIDEACRLLKDTLPTLAGAQAGSVSVMEIKWEEMGPDQADDHYNTMTRRASFRMTLHR
jgi:hypothetical protein